MSHADQRQVLLFGLAPGGSHLASRADESGFHLVKSLQEYLDYTQERGEAGSEAGRRISSVVVVARHGDNLDPMPLIYARAAEMRALVTIIVVAADRGCTCSRPPQSSGFLATLRGTCDMMIATSDKDYIQFMVECLS